MRTQKDLNLKKIKKIYLMGFAQVGKKIKIDKYIIIIF